ncbi:hypothetical protein DFH09DRAFT_1112190 [Mycena vulgaris]|nr:hypothetical protein DFH09DRAFT_1112190 [Mycena vulgaris]
MSPSCRPSVLSLRLLCGSTSHPWLLTLRPFGSELRHFADSHPDGHAWGLFLGSAARGSVFRCREVIMVILVMQVKPARRLMVLATWDLSERGVEEQRESTACFADRQSNRHHHEISKRAHTSPLHGDVRHPLTQPPTNTLVIHRPWTAATDRRLRNHSLSPQSSPTPSSARSPMLLTHYNKLDYVCNVVFSSVQWRLPNVTRGVGSTSVLSSMARDSGTGVALLVGFLRNMRDNPLPKPAKSR